MPIYMKFEGIEGSAKGNYKGWIEIQSCQLGNHRGITNPTGKGSNREAGVPSISEIVITKFNDNDSTHLFRESIQGSGRKVTIEFVSEDAGAPYLSIELENVLISGYSFSSGGDSPLESLSLNFTKITYTPKPTSSDPKASANRAVWDLATQ